MKRALPENRVMEGVVVKEEVDEDEVAAKAGNEGRKKRRIDQKRKPDAKETLTDIRRKEANSERQKKLDRKNELRRIRDAKMTEEEREMKREKSRIQKRIRKAKVLESMDEKEKSAYLEKMREKNRLNMRKWKNTRIDTVSEEERQRRREVSRFSRLQRKLTMTKEERQQRRIKNYLNHCARMAEKSKEEIEIARRKRYEAVKRWKKNLSGEKLERFKEYGRRKSKEMQEKQRNVKPESYENFLEHQRSRVIAETPEKRRNRLHRFKINGAVRKLKKQLGEEGHSQEEIEKRVSDLVEVMKKVPPPPLETLSCYKPKMAARKRKRKTDAAVNKHENSNDKARMTHGPGHTTYTTVSAAVTVTSSPNNPFERQLEIHPDEVMKKDANKEGEDGHFLGAYSPGPTSPTSMTDDDSFKEMSIMPSTSTTLHSEKVIASNSNSPVPKTHEILTQNDADFSSPHMLRAIPPSRKLRCSRKLPDGVNSVGSGPALKMQTRSRAAKVNYADVPVPGVTKTNSVPSKESVQRSADNAARLRSPAATSQCTHCPASFQSLEELQSHVRSIHPAKCWKCPKCLDIVLTPQELSEHFKTNCQAQTATKNSVEVPSAKPSKDIMQTSKPQSQDNNFVCVKCPVGGEGEVKSFETLNNLTRHVKRMHPTYYWPCKQCKILKYREASLEIHIKICNIFVMKENCVL